MRITYDPEGNIVYIELRVAEPANSIDIEEGVTADFDSNGHITGLEILDARERLGERALSSVSFEHLLPLNESTSAELASD
jgi:uncharacterized protein YuzE